MFFVLSFPLPFFPFPLGLFTIFLCVLSCWLCCPPLLSLVFTRYSTIARSTGVCSLLSHWCMSLVVSCYWSLFHHFRSSLASIYWRFPMLLVCSSLSDMVLYLPLFSNLFLFCRTIHVVLALPCVLCCSVLLERCGRQ